MFQALLPRRFFLEAWAQIDAEVAEERREAGAAGEAGETVEATGSQATQATQAARATWRALWALALAASMLTALEYYSDRRTFFDLCAAIDAPLVFRLGPWRELSSFAWWSLTHICGYFVIPVIVTRKLFGISRQQDGLGFEGLRGHGGLYASLLALVLPVIIGVSFLGDFADYYPFYSNAGRSWVDFMAWEVLYVGQFFALEYFFRGFLLATCRQAMGSAAVFAMIVPYCMIHFGKPVLEAFAAIFAGVVLGTLAMRTRSIWGGVMVHVGVAITMDVAALLQGPGLPVLFWPHL